MDLHRHPQRLVHARDRRQGEAGDARAQDDRRHDDVQAVEAAGGQETRQGLRAAFDQHAAQAAPGERLEDRDGRDDAVRVGQRDGLDAVRAP